MILMSKNNCEETTEISQVINSHNQCWNNSTNLSNRQIDYACTRSDPNSLSSSSTIDVEDLANVFAPSSSLKIPYNDEPRVHHSANHRVFRGSFNQQQSRSIVPYQCSQQQQQVTNCLDNDCWNNCPSSSPQYHQQNVDYHNQNINYHESNKLSFYPCTETQWLNCPVTNCPVYSSTSLNYDFYQQKLNYHQGYEQNLNYPDEFDYYRDNYPNYCPLIQDDDDDDRQCLEDYL